MLGQPQVLDHLLAVRGDHGRGAAHQHLGAVAALLAQLVHELRGDLSLLGQGALDVRDDHARAAVVRAQRVAHAGIAEGMDGLDAVVLAQIRGDLLPHVSGVGCLGAFGGSDQDDEARLPADLFVHDLLCPGGFRSRVGVAAAGNVARETTPASVLVGAEVGRPGDGSCARSRSAPRPGPEGREQMRDHRARDPSGPALCRCAGPSSSSAER